MTTLDALHAAATKDMTQTQLEAYYAKNARVLLQYYAPHKNEHDFFAEAPKPSSLVDAWRHQNDPSFVPVQCTVPPNCTHCQAPAEGVCTRCGTILEEMLTEAPAAMLPKSTARQNGHLERVLDGLNMPLDIHLRTRIVSAFKEVEATFQSHKRKRHNLLPYRFILEKLFQEESRPDLAASCFFNVSYAKRREYESMWTTLRAPQPNAVL